jgi:hypothetical protein
MLRICKICGLESEYVKDGLGTKAQGFHGRVCYGCYLEEQRAWRGTALGREEARRASWDYAQRKRNQNITPRDV